jgi:carboxyl-terminal processing protease
MEENLVNVQQEAPKKKKSGGSLFVSGIIVGMASALMIVCVVYLGTKVTKLLYMRSGNGSVTISADSDSAIDAASVNKLQTLESTIDKYFYLHEVTEEELQDGMYKGMLEALDDPYSEYYTAEELNELMEDTEGVYYGIGAYISLDTETSLPKISGVIEGAPAEEVGLRANDIIYEVDGESTYGLSLSETVALIKGPENTEVVLTIIRDGSEQLEISIPRRKVETPTVSYKMLDDDMAYIAISEFDDVTVDQFADALATVKESGMKGLILDLRGNPGGSLTAVVDIARMILPEGLIVYTEDKNNKRTEYTCDGTRELEVPMVVLVDMNSASAAEILSGAIQDYGIGTLVGTTTFGKGIVQQIIPFADGSAVKLTISSYFTPNGRNIHGTGIEPDVVCEFDSKSYYDTENPVDNQLEKAKEVLTQKIK